MTAHWTDGDPPPAIDPTERAGWVGFAIGGLVGSIAVLAAVHLTSEPPTVDVLPTPVDVIEVMEIPAEPTHPCHEDEAAIVTPAGLRCVPVDDMTTTTDFTGYRIAYVNGGYVIRPTD